MLGGKTARRNLKNTLANIGRLALTRLFSEHYHAEVGFPDKKFDLDEVNDAYLDERPGLGANNGKRLMVWGIELGLKTVELNPGQTYMDGIRTILKDGFLPSHLIIHIWDGEFDPGYYSVIRLTSEQDARMKGESDRVVCGLK